MKRILYLFAFAVFVFLPFRSDAKVIYSQLDNSTLSNGLSYLNGYPILRLGTGLTGKLDSLYLNMQFYDIGDSTSTVEVLYLNCYTNSTYTTPCGEYFGGVVDSARGYGTPDNYYRFVSANGGYVAPVDQNQIVRFYFEAADGSYSGFANRTPYYFNPNYYYSITQYHGSPSSCSSPGGGCGGAKIFGSQQPYFYDGLSRSVVSSQSLSSNAFCVINADEAGDVCMPYFILDDGTSEGSLTYTSPSNYSTYAVGASIVSCFDYSTNEVGHLGLKIELMHSRIAITEQYQYVPTLIASTEGVASSSCYVLPSGLTAGVYKLTAKLERFDNSVIAQSDPKTLYIGSGYLPPSGIGTSTNVTFDFHCTDYLPEIFGQVGSTTLTDSSLCSTGRGIIDSLLGPFGSFSVLVANMFSSSSASSTAASMASSTINILGYINIAGALFTSNDPFTKLLTIVLPIALVIFLLGIILRIARAIHLG